LHQRAFVALRSFHAERGGPTLGGRALAVPGWRLGPLRAIRFHGLAIAKAALVAGGATILVRAAEHSGGALARGVCAVAVLAD